MLNILKSIRLYFIYSIIFLSLYSTVFATTYSPQIIIQNDENDVEDAKEENMTYPQLVKKEDEDIRTLKNTCLESKENNFQDLKATGRFASLYLNALLKYILDHNQKILEDLGLQEEEFCIYVTNNEKVRVSDKGFGLISFDISYFLLKSVYYDADIAPMISHELAHSILKHRQASTTMVLDLYKKYMEKHSETEKDININFKKYHQKQSTYIELKKQQELKADELGLKLYLNSGFKPEYYGLFFLHFLDSVPLFTDQTRKTKFSQLDDKSFEFFKFIHSSKGCIAFGNHAKEKNQWNDFMNAIQYIPYLDDPHPTDCWRFWNTFQKLQTKEYSTYKNTNTILDTVFLKLDLNKYDRLSEVKQYFLENKDNNKINDLKSDILKNLILNKTFNVKYTTDLTVPNKKDSGTFQKDNSITINFYKFVKLVSLLTTDPNINRNEELLNNALKQSVPFIFVPTVYHN